MHTICVKIKPASKIPGIDKVTDMFGRKIYEVKVKALPKNGEANKELVEILSKHFGVPKTSFRIKSGATSRSKVIVF